MSDLFVLCRNTTWASMLAMGINVICFIESFQRMNNPNVFYSMCGFCIVHILTMIFAGIGFTSLLNGDIETFQHLFRGASITYIVMMWYVRNALVGSWYWYPNFIDGSDVTENYIMQIFVMIYVCTCEGIMFILCQYKIVSARGTAKETFFALGMSYLKAGLRCIGFLCTVILQMLTLTNFVYAQTDAWSFVCYNPVLLSMIMMTDAARIQDLIERLNQNFSIGRQSTNADQLLSKTVSQATNQSKTKQTASLLSPDSVVVD
ncbi:hypothetical protein HK101_001135 [Irineochytrium annulatum]|nr:hypothetical protein HK101_001135 [Irineochytrium annulatum]